MQGTKVAPLMGKVKEDIDRVFDRFFPARFFNEPFLPFEREAMEFKWVPAFDLVENEKEYVVRLEIPGIHKENLDINLTGNLLTVTGNREMTQEKKTETFLWQERETGHFRRTIRLPADVTADKVEATYTDGLLTIVLPKQTPVKANKVLIK
jgi:HSP20 family protein